MQKSLNKEQFIELAKQLATPIDFEQLEKDKIIEKKGDWYKVIDIQKLPEHASRQVKSVQIDDKGNYLVKFPKSWKKAQKSYRRIAGKELDK
jgi:hypothetical protein